MVDKARPLHFWLITVGEPIPLSGQHSRLLRTGMLARALRQQGHQVTWWTSTIDHSTKTRIDQGQSQRVLDDGTELRFLDGVRYHRNVSFRRLFNHHQLGRAFRRLAPPAPAPDLILCSFPTIELSLEAARFGRCKGVPVLLDVRDLWPDLFEQAVPKRLAPLIRLALRPFFHQAAEALSTCHAILATSQGYLDWALARTGRPIQPGDRVFPLGYQPLPVEIDHESVAARALAAAGVDRTRRVLCFIGSFGKTYDLAPVITTAQRLAAEGRGDVQFVLSGAGERASRWEAMAAGLPNLVFTGWLDRSQVAYLLRISYAGLAAYAAGAPQGLPNKFFEYLAGGLPIISGLQGEGAETLRQLDCGVTYDPTRPETTLAAVRQILDEPSFHARLARNARLAFESQFSSTVIYPAMIDHLTALARSR